MYKGILRAMLGGSNPRTKSLFERGLKIARAEGNTYVEGLMLKNQARYCSTNMDEKRKQLKVALGKFQDIEAFDEAHAVEAFTL